MHSDPEIVFTGKEARKKELKKASFIPYKFGFLNASQRLCFSFA